MTNARQFMAARTGAWQNGWKNPYVTRDLFLFFDAQWNSDYLVHDSINRVRNLANIEKSWTCSSIDSKGFFVNNSQNYYSDFYGGYENLTIEMFFTHVKEGKNPFIGTVGLYSSTSGQSQLLLNSVSYDYPNWGIRLPIAASSHKDFYYEKANTNKHIALMIKNGVAFIYINGIKKLVSNSFFMDVNLDILRITGSSYRQSVRVYRTFLTDEELVSNYNTDISRYLTS